MAEYLAVVWHHDGDDEPVELFSEINDDRWELRRVERYRDGRWDWVDESTDDSQNVLAEVPLPPLAEIAGDPEFDGRVITADEFERVWQQAREAS